MNEFTSGPFLFTPKGVKNLNGQLSTQWELAYGPQELAMHHVPSAATQDQVREAFADDIASFISAARERGTPERVMLIDPEGREAIAIRAQLDSDRQRRILTALSRYAQRYDLDRADPAALWAQHDRLYDDAEVAAFVKAGGMPAALVTMKRATIPETPAFDPPEQDFTIVSTPPVIAKAEDPVAQF